MEFNDVISKRQSVREFSSETIADDYIDILLDSAKKAPIARGLYGDYKLVVIQGETLKEMQKVFIDLNKDITYGCSLMIVVAYKGLENEPMEQSIGSIIENMHLEATNLGLGSVYVYNFKPFYSHTQKLHNIVDFKDYVPEAALCIGITKDYKYINKKHDILTEYYK